MDYSKIGHDKKALLWLTILLLPFFLLAGCGGGEDEPAGKKRGFSLPVQVGKVVYLDVMDQVRAVGNIQADQRVVINTEVKGLVSEIPVEEGMRVKKGAQLARIDTREYELELDRLKTELAVAEIEHDKAQEGLRPQDKEKLEAQVNADESAWEFAVKEKERFEKLMAQGFVSQSELDQAVDRARRAGDALRISKAALNAGMSARVEDIQQKKSSVEGIRKRIDMAKLDLTKTFVKAPFDGVVISKRIEQGAYASAGTPVVEMIGAARLKAVLEMPQGYRGKLRTLQGVEFLAKELDQKFKYGGNLARNIRVIPDANIYSGNIKVQIDLPKPDPSLFPGVNLEALMNFGVRKKVLHVPSISLVISEQGTVVYIMKDKKAHLVPVKAYKERNEYVEIEDFTKQLGPDADLILRGSGAVFPGANVFPTNLSPETETPFNAASTDPKADTQPAESPET
ncbi:MAG: acriflavin resistance protein [Nitrospinaceae bacterium]|nr:MAG: acriflavin resistance protein [Nitrospinaceae bacterium]